MTKLGMIGACATTLSMAVAGCTSAPPSVQADTQAASEMPSAIAVSIMNQTFTKCSFDANGSTTGWTVYALRADAKHNIKQSYDKMSLSTTCSGNGCDLWLDYRKMYDMSVSYCSARTDKAGAQKAATALAALKGR